MFPTTGEVVFNQSRRSQRLRFRVGAMVLLASMALIAPQMAQAAPSEADIARAQAEEEATKLSVAQIEVRLASVKAEADQALRAAQIAAEELNAANIALAEAKNTASSAQTDADEAKANFEAGKKEIASIVQTAYRDGGSEIDTLAPYVNADGLRTVETKQASIEAFSASADAKMQRVAALQQVANVMQKAADEAVVAQTEATTEVQRRTEAAQASAQKALALQETTEAARQGYLAELARKQNTTVELIQEREAALEAERAAAAEAAARAAAEEAARREAARQANAAASESPSWTPPPSYDEPPVSYPGSGGASTAIATAKSYLGVPYVWGGASRGGVDCSGLTQIAWASAGVYLPHYSKSQYDYGTKVPFNDAQPGDLLFWSSNGWQSGIYHVAIYLGGGSMIEAPAPGSSVRITSIWGWNQLMPYVVRF